MGLDIAIVRAGHELSRGDRAADFGDFFRALVDEEDYQFHLLVVFDHGVGDVLEERGFSGARRSHDEPALAFADGRHEVHDACRVALGHGFQPDALVRVDRCEFLEDREVLESVRIFPFQFCEAEELGSAIAAAGFPADPHAVAEAVFADDFGGDKNVVV